MLIKNKKLAIIASILTFIVVSIGSALIIAYLGGIPLSEVGTGQNQLYLFTAILAAAILASFVYGRGSDERASKAIKVLDETLGIEVDKNTMWKILRAVEQMPAFALKNYITMDINLVKEFEQQIKNYKSKINEEDLLKIKKIIETPVPELQNVLEMLYQKTKLEHFNILAQDDARPLLAMNLQELERILFEENDNPKIED